MKFNANIIHSIAVFTLLIFPVEAVFAIDVVPETVSDSQSQDALILLIAFVSLALFFSFMCSVAETVLLSITPSYIEDQNKKNPMLAAKLRKLRQSDIDRSLAAILTMNTIAHTVGAVEAGAQSAVVFGSAWVGFFSAILTLMILFFSEIIPKTLGAIYWPRLVTITTHYIKGLIIILYPLVLASEGITKLITKNKEVHKFSRDEFIAMAGLGKKIGEIDPHEHLIIHSLFKFRSLKATDIMTPRIVITALPQEMTTAEAQEATTNKSFSRLPVYNKDIDEITGFVLKDDILMYISRGHANVRLETLKRKVFAVPESIYLPKLLEFLLEHHQQIVIVVDEYGGLKGLVTLEDVMETLLGMEIMDEMDTIEDMQVYARQRWEKRANALGLMMNNIEMEQEQKADKDSTGESS
jgi:CBS domain containing-hemolysin-like protein